MSRAPYLCPICGATYPVPSLVRDCELRHSEEAEGDR